VLLRATTIVMISLVLAADAALAQSNPARAAQLQQQRQRQEAAAQEVEIKTPAPLLVEIKPIELGNIPITTIAPIALERSIPPAPLAAPSTEVRVTAPLPKPVPESRPIAKPTQVEPTAQPPIARFQPAGDFILDRQLKLRWTQADSGQNLSWNAAQNHCQQQGLRLPTRNELLQLFDRSTQQTTACGSARCKVPSYFKLSGKYGFYWSSSVIDQEAEYVALDFGLIERESTLLTPEIRALCVAST
jgi:hypothetical protein